MTTTLTFLGATGTVTGSRFLLDGDRGRWLVDCGLYQGEREWRRRNWEPFRPAPGTLDHVLLTHAHLDHCGYLPALVAQGYAGPIHCTEGTAALAPIVLRDSAHLQEEDARHAREHGYSRHDPPLPLYDAADVEKTLTNFESHSYGKPVTLGPDAHAWFRRAGHILGSASVLVETQGARVLFSGDLGRPRHPLLLPCEDPPGAGTVVVESTYGNRSHRPTSAAPHAGLAAAVRRTVDRGGSLLVPAFAIDRTELVLHVLRGMMQTGAIPQIPVYVDSPMALASLEVYRRPTLRTELRPDLPERPFDLPHLHAARTVEESMRLNHPATPSIIVSASGMASGGRVVHHLRHLLPDWRNTVVLVGYQAAGTRGRMLLEGARELKMHGRYVSVKAEVVVDDEFSVHADADEVVAWLRRLPEEPRTTYIVHGEEPAAHTLAQRLRAELGWCVAVPRLAEKVRVD